jgi:hypothetical protein
MRTTARSEFQSVRSAALVENARRGLGTSYDQTERPTHARGRGLFFSPRPSTRSGRLQGPGMPGTSSPFAIECCGLSLPVGAEDQRLATPQLERSARRWMPHKLSRLSLRYFPCSEAFLAPTSVLVRREVPYLVTHTCLGPRSTDLGPDSRRAGPSTVPRQPKVRWPRTSATWRASASS